MPSLEAPIPASSTLPAAVPIPDVPPILAAIARCESKTPEHPEGTQFNPDGSVHRGIINPDDIGKFQINEYWNGAAAKKLGFDIYTLEGNTRMALHMYRTQGTTPWNWSRACWGNSVDK